MLTKTNDNSTTPVTLIESPERMFKTILSSASASSGIDAFIKVSKDDSGTFVLSLTADGESLDQVYKQASRIADEKGIDDRDVIERLNELESKWPSHPGVVENAINEMIESAELARAVERCEQAIADWAATIAKAKVTKIQDLSATTGAGNPLHIQLTQLRVRIEQAK